jgi:hypothetical protein
MVRSEQLAHQSVVRSGGHPLRHQFVGTSGCPSSRGEVVIDAVAFAGGSRRIQMADLDAHIDGDTAAVERTFNELATLALD